jgi:hypothetical protein
LIKGFQGIKGEIIYMRGSLPSCSCLQLFQPIKKLTGFNRLALAFDDADDAEGWP